jgi:hypothetical protein
MGAEVASSPLADRLLAPRETHRSTVLYSLALPDGKTRAPAHRRRGTPVADLFAGASLDLYRRWHAEGDAQLPRVRHARAWAADELSLPSAESLIVPKAGRTWLFEMPAGGMVAGFTIDFCFRDGSPGEMRPCPELFDDIDAGRYELRLGGTPLLDVCLDDLEEDELRPTWGADIHRLLFAAPGSLKAEVDLDRDFAQRLVSRRADGSRPDFLTVRLPREANRFPDFLCAVTPGASAVAGHPPEVELALTVSAVTALSALSSLRESQRRAFADLSELRGPRPAGQASTRDRRALLKQRLEELADLRLATSFGVETYFDLRLLIPSMPVVEFHHELIEALGIPGSAEVTERILTRLSQGIEAEAEEIAADERVADERRWRTWSAVGGSIAAVAVPLSLIFGFLGINVEDVEARTSMGDLSRYGWYYLGIVGVVALVVLAGLAYVSLSYRDRRGG